MATSPRDSATDTSASGYSTGNGRRRGVIELARLAVEDVIRLVQQEIQLAKIEVQEMLKSNIKAAIFLGAAGLCGLLALIMLLVFIPLMFETGNHVWIFPVPAFVALIEAIVFLILAAILGLTGKNKLQIGAPPKTMTTLKEDAEWARQVLKRNGK
jgi:uncharacterized membrane protein YqjE